MCKTMDTLVKNPQTGRWIKKDGSVYKRLLQNGIKVPLHPSKQRKAFVAKDIPKADNTSLDLQKSFAVDKSETRWEQKKPHSPSDRRKVMEKCKESCFLIPDRMKFPICNKISKTDKKCSYNCRGLKGAASRAGEWKYKNVLDKAIAIATELHCYKKKS